MSLVSYLEGLNGEHSFSLVLNQIQWGVDESDVTVRAFMDGGLIIKGTGVRARMGKTSEIGKRYSFRNMLKGRFSLSAHAEAESWIPFGSPASLGRGRKDVSIDGVCGKADKKWGAISLPFGANTADFRLYGCPVMPALSPWKDCR